MKITEISANKLAASILFIIAWLTGEVSGLLAWTILMLVAIEVKIKF